ncbi:MAG: heavy metal translocating P-type ATPase [Tissierellia bacterium]|nr:heavy metal translocating P-type ATPase [Tissierellia bacterium]
MKARIAHRIKGRTRFCTPYKLTHKEANGLKYLLENMDGVYHCKVHPISGSFVVEYEDHVLPKICRYILELKIDDLSKVLIENRDFVPQEERELFHVFRDAFERRFVMRRLLPYPLRTVAILLRAGKFIKRAWDQYQITQGLNVEILDATAITVSMMGGEFGAAASIMFLLDLGEQLEDWTFKKSKSDLARSLTVNVDRVFVVDEKGNKSLKALEEIQKGEWVEVTMGNTIPVDGKVVSGIAMVNESSFTGESMPVKKIKGNGVFAGTALEEGKLIVQTTSQYDESRIHRIIDLISESEKNKSEAQKRAENLADALVKYSFLGAAVTFLLTGSFTKAKAFLMVDFSCALKLTIPIATMSAMRQASEEEVLVKGGKFLEELSHADTIVFDKTGTLTQAQPMVKEIITFEGNLRDDCLRIAACLEEHFPHSIATAVVEKAKAEGLHHEEMHSEPQYIVAHGIASTINGRQALIGSEHFIFEDEKVNYPAHKRELVEKLKEKYSLLYLAYDGELIAVLCIHDPVRPDAKRTIDQLRNLGFDNIVMLTGDHENSAAHVAKTLGVDYYKSQVLPEDKANFIRQEKEKGHKVVMIGDGINDSVALSMADIGISMYQGADIAREISDIAIGNDSLDSLVDVVKIAKALNCRIDRDYRGIIGFNSLLIVLGVFGIINNTTSSALHNSSTIVTAFGNMKSYTL